MSLQDSLEVKMKQKMCSFIVPPTKAEGKDPHQTGSITLPAAKVSAARSPASIHHHPPQCQVAFNRQTHVHTKWRLAGWQWWVAPDTPAHARCLPVCPKHNVSGVIRFSLNVNMIISDLMDLG